MGCMSDEEFAEIEKRVRFGYSISDTLELLAEVRRLRVEITKARLRLKRYEQEDLREASECFLGPIG